MTFTPVDRTSPTLISGPEAEPQTQLEATSTPIFTINLNIKIDGSMSNDRLRSLLRIVRDELERVSTNVNIEDSRQPEAAQQSLAETPGVE